MPVPCISYGGEYRYTFEKDIPGAGKIYRVKEYDPSSGYRTIGFCVYRDDTDDLAELAFSFLSDAESFLKSLIKDDATGLQEQLDTVYHDRNNVVMLAAAFAHEIGYLVGIREDPDQPDWPVLYIMLPTGQVSWHISKDDLIGYYREFPFVWDRHDNRTKERRIRTYVEGELRREDDIVEVRMFYGLSEPGKYSQIVAVYFNGVLQKHVIPSLGGPERTEIPPIINMDQIMSRLNGKTIRYFPTMRVDSRYHLPGSELPDRVEDLKWVDE